MKIETNANLEQSEVVEEMPAICADETLAVEFFERQIWQGTPKCAHCQSANVYQMKDAKTGGRNKAFLWRCHDCKKQFTIRLGTVFEESRIPLRHWAYAIWRASSSKKGVAALEIQRHCQISYPSALFLMHRIRLAMTPKNGASPKLAGIVEVDETYVGGKPRPGTGYHKRGRGTDKVPVFGMVERGGNIQRRVVTDVSGKTLKAAIRECVAPSSLSDLGEVFFRKSERGRAAPRQSSMAAHFVNIDYDTPLILPPNLRDWLPPGHLAHFILEAVEEVDLRQIKVNDRGTGSPQYPPRMLLALLLYCYATGVFSSRRIEQATSDSVPVRMICADTHPDHDTICTFRRENKALLQETFVRVLELAQALKFLQVGQITVAVDGTKVLAHASKHSAISYEHAGKTIAQLDLEVKELLAKAEQADSTPLQEGLSIPEEIVRRQERKAALQKARTEIEARAQARYAVALAEHEEKLAERAAKKERGERVGGKAPQAPTPEPGPKDQYNFTDPESRIMKAGSGQHFEQCYNAQAAVEVDSRLIVGERVSQAPNDKQELAPTVATVVAPVASVAAVLVDSGFYSEAAVGAVEQTPAGQPTGTTVYAALEKKAHHRTVSDLEKKEEPAAPAPGAKVSEVMKHRLKTAEGKAKYKLRQQTVEPVFGIIKSVMGFRQFLLRGLEKVELEWKWVCLAYNLKRLHLMKASLQRVAQA